MTPSEEKNKYLIKYSYYNSSLEVNKAPPTHNHWHPIYPNHDSLSSPSWTVMGAIVSHHTFIFERVVGGWEMVLVR